MPAVETDIIVKATGGDAAAGEIDKASQALNRTTASSAGMEHQFQHKFQHIGLMLFAGDALRASGLGAETRQVIGTMSLALTGAASSFGAAAGPAILFVTALTAVVGIAAKLIDKHKEEAEALAKVIETQTKAKATYDEEEKALLRIQAAGGHMTSAMNDLLKADKAVSDDLKSNLLQSQAKEIEALEKQRTQVGQQQAVHDIWIKAMAVAKASIIELGTVIGNIILPGLDLFAKGVRSLVDHFSSMTSTLGQHITLTGKYKDKFDELTAAIAKAKVAHQQLASGVSSDLAKMAQMEEAHKQNFIKNQLSMYKEMQALRAADAADQRRVMDNHINAFMKSKQEELKAQKKTSEAEEAFVKHFADQMASDIGTAVAQSIVEGKNLQDSLTHAFQQMAEQAIENMIRIEIEIAIMRAMGYEGPVYGSGGVGGGGGGGGFLGFATGGTMFADKPTLAMFGEAGPEMATFTPLSSSGNQSGGGGGGGGTSIQIGSIQTNVHGVQDPKKIADSVGDLIIQRIRGMGDLNFVRS